MKIIGQNAIAGRTFDSFAALEGHLDAWTREIADERVHGTTGEAPMERFAREDAKALRAHHGHCALPDHPGAEAQSAGGLRHRGRRQRLLGALAPDRRARAGDDRGRVLRIHHAGREVAVHPRQVGRRQRLVDPAHFEGVAGFRAKTIRTANRSTAAEEEPRRRCCGRWPSATRP